MSRRHRTPTSPVIRASEIGQWLYCRRAWWLARQGHENRNTAALKAGTRAHEQHARTVASAYRTRLIALALLILAILLLAAALFSSLG